MNKWCVNVVISRDARLVRLPPLKQHWKSIFLQTQIWTASHVAKLHIPSPLEYRWQKGKDSLQPVYFEGPLSADFLQDLVCSCKGKSPCKKTTCLLRGKPCMYRFMLLPRVRMMQTCTNAYVERGHKLGNWTINVSWNSYAYVIRSKLVFTWLCKTDIKTHLEK